MSKISQMIAEDIKQNPEAEDFYKQESARLDMAYALLKLRESLNLTQVELAQKANKPQSTISRIESGKMNVSIEVLIQIASSVGKELKIEFV